MAETADVVVVGLGAVGSAALHRLARAGVKAVGIDRYRPPHAFGATHGESRITRLAVGEGSAYAPLVRRSHEIWRELEAETGESLFLQTGGLILGPRSGAANHHGKDDFVRRTIQVAAKAGIPHDVLDAGEIRARFPQFTLTGDELAVHEPSAGVVFPERAVAVQLRLAEQLGATLHLDERVTAMHTAGAGVTVVTNRRTLHAGRVILSAGPWLPELAGGRLAELARVHRQTLHWFGVDDPAAYAPGRFPVFIWMHGDHPEEYFYGFPILPGSVMVKVASERYGEPITPDKADRTVTAAESAEVFHRHVRGRLAGVLPECGRAAACLYTVTPDAGFIVDTLPDHPGVLVACACSGHGFKHSAALGETLARRSLADPVDEANAFRLGRYDTP